VQGLLTILLAIEGFGEDCVCVRGSTMTTAQVGAECGSMKLDLANSGPEAIPRICDLRYVFAKEVSFVKSD
jgi:hypothetical protein